MSSAAVTILQDAPQIPIQQLANRIRSQKFADGIVTAEALVTIGNTLNTLQEALTTPIPLPTPTPTDNNVWFQSTNAPVTY